MLPTEQTRLAGQRGARERGEIRGLTLRHPWAWAFMYASKDVENRTWRPERQGGRVGMFLALHGGSARLTAAYCEEITEAMVWMQAQGCVQSIAYNFAEIMPTGIVAVARLDAVRHDSPSPWAVLGQVHWCLGDVVVLPEPVPHRGAQGLWELEPAALARVRELFREARAV